MQPLIYVVRNLFKLCSPIMKEYITDFSTLTNQVFIYSIVTLHIFFIGFLQLSTGCYRLGMFDFATLELFCQLVLNFQHSFDVCLCLLESMCQEILTF